MVCVFAELAVPSLRAEPARSAGPEPTITRRSHQRAGGDEAASREHSRSGAPSAATEGSKSLSHRCAQNSGLGDWSAKPSWNGGAQGLRNARFLGCSQRPTHTGAGHPRMPGPMISGLPRSWEHCLTARPYSSLDKDRDHLGAIRTANAPFYGRRPWLPRRRPSGPGEFRWQRQRRECRYFVRFGAHTLRPIRTAITTVPASVSAPVAA
jgi:hypothetical protein